MPELSERRFRGANVYINVYDLSQVNTYTYDFGVGAFHSGVEVMGTEYTFGGHESSASGIFTHTPRQVFFSLNCFYAFSTNGVNTFLVIAGTWCNFSDVYRYGGDRQVQFRCSGRTFHSWGSFSREYIPSGYEELQSFLKRALFEIDGKANSRVDQQAFAVISLLLPALRLHTGFMKKYVLTSSF